MFDRLANLRSGYHIALLTEPIPRKKLEVDCSVDLDRIGCISQLPLISTFQQSPSVILKEYIVYLAISPTCRLRRSHL